MNTLFSKRAAWTYEWEDGTLEIRVIDRQRRTYGFTWITKDRRWTWTEKRLAKINAWTARQLLQKQKPILILKTFTEGLGFITDVKASNKPIFKSNFTAPSFPFL